MKKLLPVCAAFQFTSCSDDGWQDLFNGENLDGWHAYGIEEGYNGWYVDQGVIAFDPGQRTAAQNSNLVTDQEFTSFELSMEWLISENGNSGLFWNGRNSLPTKVMVVQTSARHGQAALRYRIGADVWHSAT